MDTIFDIRFWSAGAGAVLGDYLGSFDSLMYALVAFIVTDYVMGVLCAIVERRLSSTVGVPWHLPEGVYTRIRRRGECP